MDSEGAARMDCDVPLSPLMRDVGQGMAFSWWQLGIGVELEADDTQLRRTAKRRKLTCGDKHGAARAAFASYGAAERADNDADGEAGGADAASMQRVEALYMRCVAAIESMACAGARASGAADGLDHRFALSELVPTSGSDSDDDARMPPLRLLIATTRPVVTAAALVKLNPLS